MGAQMRTRGLDWLALAGCVIAFVVAVLPTYKVEFMASPVSSEVFVERVSWFSPLIFGYGDPLPIVAGVLLAVILLCSLLGAFGSSRPGVLVVLSAVALVVMGLDVLIFGSGLLFWSGGIRGVAIAAPAGAALVLVASVLSFSSRRRGSKAQPEQAVDSVAPQGVHFER